MEANANIDRYTNMLSVLKSGDPGKYRSVMTNYDSLLNRIQHIITVKKVSINLEKANNYYSKKDTRGEKNALLLLLKEMNSRKITDEDLSGEGLKDYRSDSSLSFDKIKNRLQELGWRG